MSGKVTFVHRGARGLGPPRPPRRPEVVLCEGWGGRGRSLVRCLGSLGGGSSSSFFFFLFLTLICCAIYLRVHGSILAGARTGRQTGNPASPG